MPTDHADNLDTAIQFIKGVGPKLAERFRALGIKTARDMLWHIPHSYQDQRTITPLNRVKTGELVAVRGLVTSVNARRPKRRGRVREIITVRIDDGECAASIVWFNQSYIKNILKRGMGLQVYGRAELYDSGLQFSSPEFTVLDPGDLDSPGEILPLYNSTKGLPQRTIRRTVDFILGRLIEHEEDAVPVWILEKSGFPTIKNAWRILHQPGPDDGAPLQHKTGNIEDQEVCLFDTIDEAEYLQRLEEARKRKKDSNYERARQRLAYEEFLVMQVLLARARNAVKRIEGIAHPVPDLIPDADGAQETDAPESQTDEEVSRQAALNPKQWPYEYLKALPFVLTNDQHRVLQELQDDLSAPHPMNRLLQGDVGSGKTVVALYAMLAVASGGYQAALMAPTEILAEQHHATVLQLTRNLRGLNCGILLGSAGAKERKELQQALRSGDIQLLIGTHALFEDPVIFDNLGLVIVDEQHRFGVEQRRKLLAKGKHPDLLLMTATPIPRTLALSWYGDMDTSTIRELPAGRPKVTTRWTSWDKEEKVWEFVAEKIETGRQCFVVCPLIDDSEALPALPSAEQTFQRLQEGPLAKHRLALLHGQMSSEEKSGIMEAFGRGDYDLIVSTTVIEVGIDVPNATIMVVLGADRFGLAQLHQLRGRVGRGTHASYCVLVTGAAVSPLAERRLRALESTRDGFRLAEEDLRLRGPGEIFGQRQSGLWTFLVADGDRDLWLLEKARDDASGIVREDPSLKKPQNRVLAQRAKALHEAGLRG